MNDPQRLLVEYLLAFPEPEKAAPVSGKAKPKAKKAGK